MSHWQSLQYAWQGRTRIITDYRVASASTFPFPFIYLSASFRWRLTSSIDDPFGMFGLPTAEIGDDFVQTVVLHGVLVADSPNFLDDLIAVHG